MYLQVQACFGQPPFEFDCTPSQLACLLCPVSRLVIIAIMVMINSTPWRPGPRRPNSLVSILNCKGISTFLVLGIFFRKAQKQPFYNIGVYLSDDIFLVILLKTVSRTRSLSTSRALTLDGKPREGWLNHKDMRFGSSPTSPSTLKENNPGIPLPPR
jgi:hypothetical protein